MNKFWIVLILGALVAGPFVYQNCAGTRTRTADLSVSMATVQAQLDTIKSYASQGQGQSDTFATYLNSFFQMMADPNSTLYYSEAGGDSSLGSIPLVMPLNLQTFDPATPAPTKLYAYFVETQGSGGIRGALIIAGGGGSTTSSSTSTTSTLQSATPTTAAASDPSTSLSFIYVMANDGTIAAAGTGGQGGAPLDPADVTDTDFTLDMNFQDSFDVSLYSTDLDGNGDLTDVVQFNLYQETQGDELSIGLINMAIPSN